MKWLKKIFIADVFLLLTQGILLFFWLYNQAGNSDQGALIHFIFTTKDNVILFLNPPLLIFILYMHLFLKHKMNHSILKHLIIGVFNFILLYFISWIEMLMLVSLKFKI